MYTKAGGDARVEVELSEVPPLSQILETSHYTLIWHINVFFWSDSVAFGFF